MNRRHWLHLSALALAGSGQAQTATTTVNAGSFLVTVPDGWAETAIIKKVPILGPHSPEQWKALQAEGRREKPTSDCRPQHWALHFPRATLPGKNGRGEAFMPPEILIQKTKEWAVVFTDGIHEEKPAAEVVQSWRNDLKTWKTKDLPHAFPLTIDAELTFICLKKPLKFDGGDGVRMLAQWTNEATLMEKGQLSYLFLGMSKDNSCLIAATIPIDVPGLPDGGHQAEHLGWSNKHYGKIVNEYDQYGAAAKKWLENNAANFTPSLDTLDDIMQSLVVRQWQ